MTEPSEPSRRRSIDEWQEQAFSLADKMRQLGLSSIDMEVAQLGFFGNQSCGKSSVINALSKINFPTQSGLCTRFATELVLRQKVAQEETKISIRPDEMRTEQEKDRLRHFTPSTTDLGQLDRIIDQASVAMGIDSKKGGSGFSKDVLRIEVAGPDVSTIDLVDLPGIVHSPQGSQNTDDVERVKQLIRHYMNRPKMIIVAVVQAQDNIACQEVIRLAREYDPHGKRTFGVVTKPDRVDDEHQRREYSAIIRNESGPNLKYELGWHLLRNKTPSEKSISWEDHAAKEQAYLNGDDWQDVDVSSKGIGNFTKRIAMILADEIVNSTTTMLQSLAIEETQCKHELNALSTATSVKDLEQILTDYNLVMGQAVEGRYEHSCFRTGPVSETEQRRLRENVLSILDQFTSSMSSTSSIFVHKTDQKLAHDHNETMLPGSNNKELDASQLIEQIVTQLTSNGKVPGQFDSHHVMQLFLQHSQPWTEIVSDMKSSLVIAVGNCCHSLLKAVCADQMVTSSILGFADPALKKVINLFEKHIAEIANTIIVPNSSAAANLILQTHARSSICSELERLLDQGAAEVEKQGFHVNVATGGATATLRQTLKQLKANVLSLVVPERFAAIQVQVGMQHLYKIQRDKLIGRLDYQFIDDSLLSKLPQILKVELEQSNVRQLTDFLVESQETRESRQRVLARQRLITSLQAACRHVRALSTHKGNARKRPWVIESSDDDFEAHGDVSPHSKKIRP